MDQTISLARTHVMCVRMGGAKLDAGYRGELLRDILCDGPAWGPHLGHWWMRFVTATTPKSKRALYKKTLGATAVKHIATDDAIGGIVPEEQATKFRELTAQANYLSLDRPEAACAS